ncbi:MAG: aldehyde dehydrogenase [Chitinophagales bacterium]|nr:MAG: aldehyde dehydrogenase [Chitinophagales bacterium]
METTTTQVSSSNVRAQVGVNTPVSEIHRLFELQQKNKQRVRNTTAKERRNKLKKLEKTLFSKRQAIRQAMYNDFRKAATETDLTEIYTLLLEIRHAVEHLQEWMQPQEVETPLVFFGTSARVMYEPKGCALIISPWNYPINLSFIPLVSAVAAGCTAIIKPSEYTPHTSAIIREIVSEVFDASEVSVVEGDHTVSQELLKLKFDHIFFTGSPSVGKLVMKAAADHLTSVTLELGGKSPVIVDASANIEDCARSVAWGKCVNSGQTCVSPDYLLIHESLQERFVEEFKKSVLAMYGAAGEELKNNPDYCRIVNRRHYTRIKNLIMEAIEKGAHVAFGGAMDDAENFIAPTLLTDVPDNAEIMHEEIFGPVFPIRKFTDIREAVDYVNAKEKPLALYVFSSKQKHIDYVLQNTSSGGACVNETMIQFSHVHLPFGGVNHSGMGKAHGFYGFKTFSNEKAVLRQHLKRMVMKTLYPPYKGPKLRIIEFMLKYL